MDQDMLTAAEAASLLDVSPGYVRRLVDSGDLPGSWETQTGECCIPRNAVLRIKEKMARESGQDRTADATANVAGYGKPEPGAPAPRIEV